MKQEWAKPWIDALRSGGYTQGRGYLRTKDDEFCCLGVLCDLVAKQNENLQWKQDEAHPYWIGDKKYASRMKLIPEVMEITGIKTSEGLIRDNRIDGQATVKNLTVMNDAGKTFNEIADIIEKGWELL